MDYKIVEIGSNSSTGSKSSRNQFNLIPNSFGIKFELEQPRNRSIPNESILFLQSTFFGFIFFSVFFVYVLLHIFFREYMYSDRKMCFMKASKL